MTYRNICAYLYTYVCMYVCMHVCIYIYIYIHVPQGIFGGWLSDSDRDRADSQ